MGRKMLLTELAARGRLVSSTDALSIGAELGLSPDNVHQSLVLLRKDGWLTSLQRGLDVITTPGAASVHPFVIATALAPDATVSGWAAIHHYGLTEQLPKTTEVITTRELRSESGATKRLVAFEGERLELMTVAASRMFGIDEAWLQGGRARILSKERAILELFLRPREFGGLETALSMLEEHAHEIDARQLVDVALELGIVSVAKRVGWALEHAAGASPVVVEPLRALPTTSYGLLDPSKPARGPRQSRWHLRENMERAAQSPAESSRRGAKGAPETGARRPLH